MFGKTSLAASYYYDCVNEMSLECFATVGLAEGRTSSLQKYLLCILYRTLRRYIKILYYDYYYLQVLFWGKGVKPKKNSS